MKKKIFAMLIAAAMMLSMAACGNGTEEKKTENSAGTEAQAAGGESTLVYGSNDYTRINPAMDEHGEINILIFSGLTSHDGENQVAPGLAKSWDYDEVEFMADNRYTPTVRRIGLPDKFVEHGPVKDLHRLCGMDEEGIYKVLVSF